MHVCTHSIHKHAHKQPAATLLLLPFLLQSLKYLLTIRAYVDVIVNLLPRCQNGLSLVQAQVLLFADIVSGAACKAIHLGQQHTGCALPPTAPGMTAWQHVSQGPPT
jgi:hypothetical protein